MPLSTDVKQQIIAEYGTAEGDTGSPEVQIALLTQRIKDLTEHSRAHKHDTTVVAACCSSSVVAAGCCAIWRASTSSDTAR